MSAIQIPTLCIPRVFSRVTDRVIYGTFERLFGKGCIANVMMKQCNDRKTGEPYYFATIQFNAYTPMPLIPRASVVSPTIENTENGAIETAEATEDELFERISGFITQLANDEEVRIEYRAPYYFKVRKFTPPPPRAPRPMPRILPSVN